MNMQQKEYQAMTDPFLSHINLGTGKDISIKDLVKMIKEIAGFKGHIYFDPDKPDGPPRKCLDTRVIKTTGFSPAIRLRQGIKQTYAWFLKHHGSCKTAA